MKRSLGILLVAQLAAGAATAESLFVGDAFVLTSTCSTFAVGDFGRVVYRPRGSTLGNGTTDSYLSYSPSRSGITMVRVGGNFANNAPLHTYGAGSKANAIDDAAATATVWTQTPAALTAATKAIKVDATITGFFSVASCVVTLRLNLAKQ